MKIVYYSASGNTEKMANLIAEGIANGGKTAEVINVSNANADIFDNEEIVILGCPAMGDEVLEENEFEPFVEEISAASQHFSSALCVVYRVPGVVFWERNQMCHCSVLSV